MQNNVIYGPKQLILLFVIQLQQAVDLTCFLCYSESKLVQNLFIVRRNVCTYVPEAYMTDFIDEKHT